MVNERRRLILIFVIYFLLGIGYSLLMPIWEAPDEPAHYHLAWRIARKGMYAPLNINYEANQPRAYYYVGSLVIRALDSVDPRYSDYILPREYIYNIRVPERRFEWNDENYRFLFGVYTLRWINLVFGGLALWLNWKTFKSITPDKPPLALAALALAGLTPQYLHIMSSVNNDAAGTLSGAILLYLAVKISDTGNIRLTITSAILAILLPLTSKLTALPVGAAVLTMIAVKWLKDSRRKRWLTMFGSILLLGAGLVYLFLPNVRPSAASEIAWRLFSFHERAWTLEYLTSTFNQILATYWGQVGWLAVGLPAWSIILLTALGFLGIFVKSAKFIQSRLTHPQFNRWLAVFLTASFSIIAVARNGLTTGATQGRLLFPAIGSLSFLMIGGYFDLLPEKYQQRLPAFVILLMVSLNLGLWFFGIIPIYYQPFLD